MLFVKFSIDMAQRMLWYKRLRFASSKFGFAEFFYTGNTLSKMGINLPQVGKKKWHGSQ